MQVTPLPALLQNAGYRTIHVDKVTGKTIELPGDVILKPAPAVPKTSAAKVP